VISGLAELEKQVHKHKIECEWSPQGHLTAVVESKRAKNLRATVRTLEATGDEYEWLEGDALADVEFIRDEWMKFDRNVRFLRGYRTGKNRTIR